MNHRCRTWKLHGRHFAALRRNSTVSRAWQALVLAIALTMRVPMQAQTAAPPSVPKTMSVAQAIAALKGGGYVVYFRHAATDFSRNDEKMRDFDDCGNQRNLTDAGRAQAKKIGAAWRSLGIPVGRVSASPFCRTRETAQIIFGRYERTQEARGGPGTADDPARYKPLAELLASAPRPGTNDIVVSHGNPFRALHPGSAYLGEGDRRVRSGRPPD